MKKLFIGIIVVIVLALLICASVSIYKLNVYTEERVDKLLDLGNTIKSNNYYYEINRYVENDSDSKECVYNYKKYFLNNNTYEINTFVGNEKENFEIIYDYSNKTEYVIGQDAINCNKNVDFVDNHFKELFDYRMDLSKIDRLQSNAFQYDGKEVIDGAKCIKIGIQKKEDEKYCKNVYYINEEDGLIVKKDFYIGQSYDELALYQTETYTHKYDILKETDIKTFNIDNYPNYNYYEVDVSNSDEVETIFNNIDVTYDSESISPKSIKLFVSDLNEPKADSFEINEIKIIKSDGTELEVKAEKDIKNIKEKFQNEIEINWTEKYGQLEKGIYILNIDLTMNRTNNTNINKDYSIEFEIK